MEMIEKVRKILMGYKTYIFLLLMLGVAIAEQEGLIWEDTAEQVYAYLMLGGGASLTAKLQRFLSASAPKPTE